VSIFTDADRFKDRVAFEREILLAAYDYSERLRWSVVLTGENKKPVEKWKYLQYRRRTDSQIERGFHRILERRKRVTGLAVVFGDGSENLIGRDWDTEIGYLDWVESNARLAAEMPTVRTARGYVTLCRLRSLDGLRNRKLDGRAKGELRVHNYSLLPPSLHPDGIHYRWHGAQPFSQGDIPLFPSLKETGFVKQKSESCKGLWAVGRDPERIQTGNTNACVSVTPTDVSYSEPQYDQITDCIIRSLPHRVGERWHRIVSLVLRLKDLPFFQGASTARLDAVFERWFAIAVHRVGTQDRSESKRDFATAWENIHHSMHRVSTGMAIAERLELPLPSLPDCLYGFRNCEPTRRLMAVCEVLDVISGGEPFPLSVRYAAAMAGFGGFKTANRRIERLREVGILKRVTEGSNSSLLRIAATYQFLGIPK